jgi:hypothetical protein
MRRWYATGSDDSDATLGAAAEEEEDDELIVSNQFEL